MPAKKPLAIIMGKGNAAHLTKSEIEERKSSEIKAPHDKVIAPTYLPKKLKDRFDEIASDLIDIGIMSNLDTDTLAKYVVSEFQYQTTTKKILRINIEDEKYMSLLIVQEKLFKMARMSAGDLGLTISSRCKLVIPKSEKAIDPVADRFGNL